MIKIKDPAAVALGKKSAAKRKKMGHDSEYYRKLIQRRWAKRSKKKETNSVHN